MSTVQFDSQKIEQLLNAATSERQRKMYQALLNRARSQESSSTPEKTAKTTPSTVKKTQTTSKTQAKTQKKTKTVKKNKKENPESAAIEVLRPTKQSSPTGSESKLAEGSSDVPPQTETKSQSKKSEKQFYAVKPTIFQAIGSVIATPHLKEDRLKVVINGCEYDLLSAKGFRRYVYTRLKEELEKNGSSQMFLRLYPHVKYDYKSQEFKLFFSLVCFNRDCEKINDESKGFVLRGIWQYIEQCKSPVISIYRNRERMEVFKSLNKQSQFWFARPHHLPVVWNAPVEPFKYNPQVEKDSQMPRYFVQVRAILKDGLYVVKEMLSEPTVKIPQYIKLPKKEQDKSVEQAVEKSSSSATQTS